MTDQDKKADAGKPNPRVVRTLPNLDNRAVLLRTLHLTKGNTGMMYSFAKDCFELLPISYRTTGLYRALRFGEKKYSMFSWREVENGAERYLMAGIRHFIPEMYYPQDREDWLDSESGLHHFSHAAASFAIVLDILGKDKL